MVRRSVNGPCLQTARGSSILGHLLFMAKGVLRDRRRSPIFGNRMVTLQPLHFYSVHLPVTVFGTKLTGEITGTLYFQGESVIGRSRL